MRHLEGWTPGSHDLAWACLRAYIGIALFIKGLVYLAHGADLQQLMSAAGVPLASRAFAEVIALTHLGGGLLLTFGFMTRFAALVQVPNVLGAVLFVHLRQGLFQRDQSLELALLVLVVLLVFAVAGPGRWSVDASFATSSRLADQTPGVSSQSTVPRTSG